MRNALIGAVLLGLAGCSVDTQVSADINSKPVPAKKASSYRILNIDDNKSTYGYHVIEVKGGGKTYLVLQQRWGDGVSLIKLDERRDRESYNDKRN